MTEDEKNNQSPESDTETTEAETGTEIDIKTTPEYIAMKDLLDNQTAELQKLQKQVKDLQVEKEKMALSFGIEEKKQEQIDNAWLGFSRYSHKK